jgi:hypothetical protein
MISDFNSDTIYKYLDNYIRTINNYGHYKIKEVVILKIDRVIGFQIIVVDYKVSIYKSGFGFVEGSITLDLADPQTKRDLILNEIID